MDLELLHENVSKAISSLDFERIWPSFRPLRFALYDAERCFFDGNYIEKTDEFCANTSISYRGEQIAIWMVQEELDIPTLTSKIVHEMFHGYQNLKGWDCWPNELEALYRYRYDSTNLGIKLHENELLLSLLDHFDDAALKELLSFRKRRNMERPYEFLYESKVEEIEGTANYVEWQVLKQLDENKAQELVERMRTLITKPEYLFPIRISCYFTGALTIHALRAAGTYSFETDTRPTIFSRLEGVSPRKGTFADDAGIIQSASLAIRAFQQETKAIVDAALEKNNVALEGPFELVGVNVYNARRLNEFLTTTHFVMYKDGPENKMLQGDFVIKMKDEKTIDVVYRQ